MPAPQDGPAALAKMAELQTIYDEAPIGLCVLDLDQRFVRVNRRLAEMNGFPVEAHAGRHITDLLPDLAEQADALFRRILETGRPITDIEIVGETAAEPGVERIWRESWYPLRDAGGTIVAINVVAREITEQKRAATALRDSERRFRELADNVPAMIWVTDADNLCTFINQAWCDFTGQRPEEGLGLGWLDAVHPDDREHSAQIFRDAAERRVAFQLDYRLRRSDGAWRWCLDMGKPRHDGDGHYAGYAGTVIDISERKETEQRQATMMRELDHRAKNMLTAVLAVMRLTRARDIDSYVDAVEGRVQALASAHMLIARNRWEAVSLRGLLAEQLAPWLGTQVTLDGPDLMSTPAATQALAIIVHELATNAARHGALSQPDGHIAICWQSAEAGGALLVWQERGGPQITAPAHHGLGWELIRTSARNQLDGRADGDWRAEGLSLTLEIGPDALRRTDNPT